MKTTYYSAIIHASKRIRQFLVVAPALLLAACGADTQRTYAGEYIYEPDPTHLGRFEVLFKFEQGQFQLMERHHDYTSGRISTNYPQEKCNYFDPKNWSCTIGNGKYKMTDGELRLLPMWSDSKGLTLTLKHEGAETEAYRAAGRELTQKRMAVYANQVAEKARLAEIKAREEQVWAVAQAEREAQQKRLIDDYKTALKKYAVTAVIKQSGSSLVLERMVVGEVTVTLAIGTDGRITGSNVESTTIGQGVLTEETLQRIAQAQSAIVLPSGLRGVAFRVNVTVTYPLGS